VCPLDFSVTPPFMIAGELGIEHNSLVAKITKYEDLIEDEFGHLRFEIESPLEGEKYYRDTPKLGEYKYL
jgi:hypothetical protein